MVKHLRRVAVFLPLVAVGVLLYVFSATRSTGGPPPGPTRPDSWILCPKLVLASSAKAKLLDRRLRNLGGHVLGETRRYAAGPRWRFEVHVGHEALEPYEDIDFEPRGTIVAGERNFSLVSAAALGDRFWAATFELERAPECCRDVTILGRDSRLKAHAMGEDAFRALVATFDEDTLTVVG